VLPLDAYAEADALLRLIFCTNPVSRTTKKRQPKSLAVTGFRVVGSLVHRARQRHSMAARGFRRDHERSIRGALRPVAEFGSQSAPARR
jgi:hypothetical protein